MNQSVEVGAVRSPVEDKPPWLLDSLVRCDDERFLIQVREQNIGV